MKSRKPGIAISLLIVALGIASMLFVGAFIPLVLGPDGDQTDLIMRGLG